MTSPNDYFDDKNHDNIPDGWAAAHKRMLAIDRNRNKIPDDFEPFVKDIERQVRLTILAYFAGMFILLAVLVLIGWLVS